MELVFSMSEERRALPADMLLLRERQRCLHARDDGAVENDVLVLESDAIVDESTPDELRATRVGTIALYRPLAHVTLARISWSGAVDHEALQEAIVCSPPRDGGSGKTPSWLSAVTTFALGAAPRGEAALHVALGADDISVLDRVGTRLARGDAIGIVLAAALPTTIVEADVETVSAASPIFVAYRHAALVYAWQVALSGRAAADAAQERDAAAVQLLSALRALLGEV
jgi:hypothetical protein